LQRRPAIKYRRDFWTRHGLQKKQPRISPMARIGWKTQACIPISVIRAIRGHAPAKRVVHPDLRFPFNESFIEIWTIVKSLGGHTHFFHNGHLGRAMWFLCKLLRLRTIVKTGCKFFSQWSGVFAVVGCQMPRKVLSSENGGLAGTRSRIEPRMRIICCSCKSDRAISLRKTL
jgi:hypothetical protein